MARLATIDASHNPHLVPVCFAPDEGQHGDTVYTAVDAKPKASPDLKRLRNIAGHPHVTLLVDHYEDDWTKVWWVRLDGTAIVHDTGTPAHARGRGLLADKYEQYRDAPEMLGRMVVIHALRWTAWAYADFG
ncbi:MAG: TIGR03668 family PPOX class F420-dependent oxidoreductase [Acidimicrobiia bacterium]|nr:TIGR03668 family PPOX class F420-dependent oxidoreductase [Acidimicrobiia bacterium]